MKSTIIKTHSDKFLVTLHPTWQYNKKRKWSVLFVGITTGFTMKTLAMFPLANFLISVVRNCKGNVPNLKQLIFLKENSIILKSQ